MRDVCVPGWSVFWLCRPPATLCVSRSSAENQAGLKQWDLHLWKETQRVGLCFSLKYGVNGWQKCGVGRKVILDTREGRWICLEGGVESKGIIPGVVVTRSLNLWPEYKETNSSDAQNEAAGWQFLEDYLSPCEVEERITGDTGPSMNCKSLVPCIALLRLDLKQKDRYMFSWA